MSDFFIYGGNFMKKLSGKILSVLLVIAMLVPTGILMVNTNAENGSLKTGDIIEFGTYPQTLVTDKTLLSELVLNAPQLKWVSYNYYSGNRNHGSAVIGDYMRYADVKIGEDSYRAVCFDEYRPYRTYEQCTANMTFQDENNYFTNTVYWFKYEPLTWKVLDAETGLVVSEKAIDAQAYCNVTDSKSAYNNTGKYVNDYETSAIRAWLNDSFYNLAFSDDDKNTIYPTALDNSAESGSTYNSKTTYDKVFLLSYNDALNKDYFPDEASRKISNTDYAECQGAYNDSNYNVGSKHDGPYYYLRTADDKYASNVCTVMAHGGLSGCIATECGVGIRPAMYITLNSFIQGIPDDAIKFNGHYYKAYDIPMSWTDAESYCKMSGGYLTSITSAAENEFIYSIIKNRTKNVYWLGGYTLESDWRWVTGESFEYKNWGDKKPDNLNENENYLQMYRIAIGNNPVSSWNDEKSDGNSGVGSDYALLKTGFICEWDTKGYTISGRTFYKNIDYFTSFTLSSEYNPVLANMTAALSEAVYSEKKIKEAYASLGFPFCERLDDNGAYDPYSCAYSIGVKQSEYNDDQICLISVRGTNNNSDWSGNLKIFDCDLEGKHNGFAQPADRIYKTIQDLFDNNISGNVKYVITGHSRGAAVANLLAVQLMENGVSPTDVYNYNFACPDVACRASFGNYVNIFNLCNREDAVPFIPGNTTSFFTWPGLSWGKFGQTYWFTKDKKGTINPIKDHSMSLYLEFFDQQKKPEEWGRSFWDKVDDNVHWTMGWVSKIFCPVDVIVKDADGNIIASVIGGEVNYYDSSFGDVIILTDGDKKIIFVSGDNDFNVELIGTDDGTMTYSVEKCNLATEEISESKTFENVKLEKGKEMYSPVSNAETTEDIELFVVKDENGENVMTNTINTDGTETEINHIYETEVVNPTCTEKGYTVYTCSNCSDSYKDSYVDALGHSDTNHDGICDACSEDFTKGCSCNCHGNAFMQFIHKILCFIYKLFGMTQYQYCDCGKAHW